MADENRMITFEYAFVSLSEFKKSNPPNTLKCMTKSELNHYYSINQTPINSYSNNNLIRRDKVIGKQIDYYCPSIGGEVKDIQFLSDGSMVMIGDFSTYNGNSCPKGILKLKISGDGDVVFNSNRGFDTSNIKSLGIQSNDKIIVGGLYNQYNDDSSVGKVIRLTSDGILDPTFNNSVLLVADINKVLVLSNNKILVGGSFTINGRSNLILLNEDGNIDTSFNPTVSYVNTLNTLYNNKILVDGILLLNMDGSVDNSYTATTSISELRCVTIQTDNKILIAGYNYSGPDVIRLNSNGSIDNSFAYTGEMNSSIYTMLLDPDGKILIGGTGINKNIRRLNTNGTIDNTFLASTGFNNRVSTIKQNSNGKLIIGGLFSTYNNQSRDKLALLTYDGALMNCY